MLDKLKIYPFEYKMKVTKFLQDGELYDSSVLDLTANSILEKFKNAVAIQTQAALAIGMPTTTTVPHSILNGFMNLASVSASSGFEFPMAKALLNAQEKEVAPIVVLDDPRDDSGEKVEVYDGGLENFNLFPDTDDEY